MEARQAAAALGYPVVDLDLIKLTHVMVSLMCVDMNHFSFESFAVDNKLFVQHFNCILISTFARAPPHITKHQKTPI